MDRASKKILIVYTDAGGGHKATAVAMKAAIEAGTPHRVILMNPYKELIADVDLFARLTPWTDEEVYNEFVLGRGWNNLFCLAYYGATLLNVRLGTRVSVRRFTACWRKLGIDMVISVMPMANQGLYQSVKSLFPTGPVPFLVAMTDLAESMKYSWFPKEKDYFIACATGPARDLAVQKPHPPEMVFNTEGLVVHPRFYDIPALDIPGERNALGLDPGYLTGCVMYGGGGSCRMAAIARAMAGLDRKVQVIFLCGRNQALAEEIRGMNLPYPHLVKTFTDEVPYFFSVSDFLVGKPGPGTIGEALVTGILPVIDTEQVLPQEQYNVTWLKQNRQGIPFRRIDELMAVIQGLPGKNPALPRTFGRVGPANRAVFRIPGIVERILAACPGGEG